MAYSVGKTSALQTAIKAGVDIALAEYAAGALNGPIMDRVQEIASELKVDLFAQVDQDNAGVATARPSGSGTASGGPVSTQDAKDMVLNFGAFKGMTLGDVAAMTRDEAMAYTSGTYKKSGLDYVKWMATNKDPKGAFSAARAQVVLADFNATTTDLNKLAG